MLVVLTPLLWVICLSTHAATFDKPLRKKIVDLGRSQYLMPFDRRRVKLTCFVYPKFMVKQVGDPGYKGAFMLRVVPMTPGKTPACTTRRGHGEKTFGGGDYYFAGVWRSLMFLVAEGGDGGELYRVVNSGDMHTLFKDLVWVGTHGELGELRSIEGNDRNVTLTYTRVFPGTCSVPIHGIQCWDKFKQELGLPAAPIPKCRNDFEGIDQGDIPSVIAYPVEVHLFPKPRIRASGLPIACYATE